ncbi:MAG: hypothetical protein MMC33_000873 [Icmadophila ericetorum]|nr:hypothetical protein [Icmadophila ericetorum]
MCYDESVKYVCGCFRAFDYYPCEFEGNQAGYCVRTSNTRVINEVCHEHMLKGIKRRLVGKDPSVRGPVGPKPADNSRSRTSKQASSTAQRSKERAYFERTNKPIPLGRKEPPTAHTNPTAPSAYAEVRRTEPERRDAATLLNRPPTPTRETPASPPQTWRFPTPPDIISKMLTPSDRARIHPISHNPLVLDDPDSLKNAGFPIVTIPPRPGMIYGAIGRLIRGEERAIRDRRNALGLMRSRKDYTYSILLYIVLPLTFMGWFLWPRIGPLWWFLWNHIGLTQIFDRNLAGRRPLSPIRYGQTLTFEPRETVQGWVAVLTIICLLPALTASYLAFVDFMSWHPGRSYQEVEGVQLEHDSTEDVKSNEKEDVVVHDLKRRASKAHKRFLTREAVVYSAPRDPSFIPDADQTIKPFYVRVVQHSALMFVAATNSIIETIGTIIQLQLTTSIIPWVMVSCLFVFFGMLLSSKLLPKTSPSWEPNLNGNILICVFCFNFGVSVLVLLGNIFQRRNGRGDRYFTVHFEYHLHGPFAFLTQLSMRTLNWISRLSWNFLNAFEGWRARIIDPGSACLCLLCIAASASIGAFPADYTFRLLGPSDLAISDYQRTTVTYQPAGFLLFRCFPSIIIFVLSSYLAFNVVAEVLSIISYIWWSILSGASSLWQQALAWVLWWPTLSLAGGIYGARSLGWRWEQVYIAHLIFALLTVFVTSNFAKRSTRLSHWLSSLQQSLVNWWYEPRTVLIHPNITRATFPMPLYEEEVEYDADAAREFLQQRRAQKEFGQMESRVLTLTPMTPYIGSGRLSRPIRNEIRKGPDLVEWSIRENVEKARLFEQKRIASPLWNIWHGPAVAEEDQRNQIPPSTSRNFDLSLGGSASRQKLKRTTKDKRVRFKIRPNHQNPTAEDVPEDFSPLRENNITMGRATNHNQQSSRTSPPQSPLNSPPPFPVSPTLPERSLTNDERAELTYIQNSCAQRQRETGWATSSLGWNQEERNALERLRWIVTRREYREREVPPWNDSAEECEREERRLQENEWETGFRHPEWHGPEGYSLVNEMWCRWV